MRSRSFLSGSMLSLAVIGILAIGGNAFALPAYSCGTNAGGGNCRQASPQPGTTIDLSSVLEAVVTGMRIFVRL